MADPKPIRYRGFIIRYSRGDWYVDDPNESDWKKRVLASVWSSKDGKRWIDQHLAENPPRQSNPGSRRHTAKFDRCVRDVKRSGTATNAYAVCTRTLGSAGLRHRPRSGNPLPGRGQVELVAVWKDRQGREHTLFKRFDSLEEARTKARRFVIAITRATGHSPRTHIVRRVPFNP